MFLLGCLVATLTLSVSVALTVLVPLAVKGYVGRDGASVHHGRQHHHTRRTLVVAMLQHTPVAARIVWPGDRRDDRVRLHLAFIYGPVKRTVIGWDDWLVAKNVRLASSWWCCSHHRSPCCCRDSYTARADVQRALGSYVGDSSRFRQSFSRGALLYGRSRPSPGYRQCVSHRRAWARRAIRLGASCPPDGLSQRVRRPGVPALAYTVYRLVVPLVRAARGGLSRCSLRPAGQRKAYREPAQPLRSRARPQTGSRPDELADQAHGECHGKERRMPDRSRAVGST
jgi:hypothetical protein